MNPRIDRLWPEPQESLDDDELLDAYPFPEDRVWVRMNFIASIDGAATRAGRSGGLGDEADRRVFELLRRPAHAILLGAGTARTEGYGAMRLDDTAVAWRTARGLAPHPVFVLITRRLDLDPESPIFTEAPGRPILYTIASAPKNRGLDSVADIVITGEREVDLARVRDDLATRGLTQVHSEGGPSLFGSFIAADAVDELCLTVAPTLEAGNARRIATAPPSTLTSPAPRNMRLAQVLRASDELLLRYVRG